MGLKELKTELINEAKKVLKKNVPSKTVQDEVVINVTNIFNKISRLARSLATNKYTEADQLTKIEETFQFARLKTYSVFKKTQTALFVPKEKGQEIRDLGEDEIQTDCETQPDEDEEIQGESETVDEETAEPTGIVQTAELTGIVGITKITATPLARGIRASSEGNILNIPLNHNFNNSTKNNSISNKMTVPNVNTIATLTNLVASNIDKYFGEEENLNCFEMGLDTIEEVYTLCEEVYKPLLIRAIKSRIKGHLSSALTAEVDTIGKIRKVVRENVLKNNMQYYENNLMTIAQIENEQTTVFVERLEKAVKNYVLMFTIHAGVSSEYAEKSAVNIVRLNLSRNAFHTDVRQCMKHSSFGKIGDITSKVKEFPTTFSKNKNLAVGTEQGASIGAIFNQNRYQNKAQRGKFQGRGRNFKGRYPYKYNSNRNDEKYKNKNRHNNHNYYKNKNSENNGGHRDKRNWKNQNKNVRVVNKKEEEEMSD